MLNEDEKEFIDPKVIWIKQKLCKNPLYKVMLIIFNIMKIVSQRQSNADKIFGKLAVLFASSDVLQLILSLTWSARKSE